MSRPAPPPAVPAHVAQLRQLMTDRELTQREVAELAGVSQKTVESWLADPSAASHRAMPARYMTTILALLPRYLAARRRRKGGA